MVYLELFISFVKIGFTSFGGMSMIPLIMEELEKHQWVLREDLANLVAIAEMTPGPLGLNAATFAGTRVAGILGGAVAVAGVLTPAFTVALCAAIFFVKFRKSTVMKKIMEVIKPICVAMILIVMMSLAKDSFLVQQGIDIIAIGISVLMFYLILNKKWSVPKVIGCSAILGMITYGIF